MTFFSVLTLVIIITTRLMLIYSCYNEFEVFPLQLYAINWLVLIWPNTVLTLFSDSAIQVLITIQRHRRINIPRRSIFCTMDFAYSKKKIYLHSLHSHKMRVGCFPLSLSLFFFCMMVITIYVCAFCFT